MYLFRTRRPRASVVSAEESSPSEPKADARTRTGDPFITRERRVRDARPLAGTAGHAFSGDQAVSALEEWTRVRARARADVPVSYPEASCSSVARRALEAPPRLWLEDRVGPARGARHYPWGKSRASAAWYAAGSRTTRASGCWASRSRSSIDSRSTGSSS